MDVMTLEAFRASRKAVDDIAHEIGGQHWMGVDANPAPQPGMVYDGGAYIEAWADGLYVLTIGNYTRKSFDLAELEEVLYWDRVDDGALDIG